MYLKGILLPIFFPIYFPTFAKTPQLWETAKRQSRGVGSWLSPFWKLDYQGYNMYENKRIFMSFFEPLLAGHKIKNLKLEIGRKIKISKIPHIFLNTIFLPNNSFQRPVDILAAPFLLKMFLK